MDKNQRAKQSRYLEVPSCCEYFFGDQEPESSQSASKAIPSPNGESPPLITWRSPVRGTMSPAAPGGESAVMLWQLPPIQDKQFPTGKAGHWHFQQFHSLVGRHSSLPQRMLALTLSKKIKQSGRQTSYFHKAEVAPPVPPPRLL